MNRRQFNKQLISGFGAILPSALFLTTFANLTNFKKMHRPAKLKTGDTVALITPGSPITPEKLEKSLANIKMMGLKAKYNPSILAKHGYLAGTDEQRLADLHQFFADPTVKAIWCVRGGYGCPRLLPKIDYNLIKKNPKILIGYSDVTALLLAITKKSKLITFHAPMTASTFTPFAVKNLKAVLMEGKDDWVIDANDFENGQYTIQPGKATGCLAGGSLSLLNALVGTPYEVDFKDKIVFIEEIGEQPYRIDRMLTQLRQGTNISKAAAIILGVFEGCDPNTADTSLTLKETLTDRLKDLGMPVYYGFPIGHISDQCTLPVGTQASFDTKSGQLVLLKTSVS